MHTQTHTRHLQPLTACPKTIAGSWIRRTEPMNNLSWNNNQNFTVGVAGFSQKGGGISQGTGITVPGGTFAILPNSIGSRHVKYCTKVIVLSTNTVSANFKRIIIMVAVSSI